MNDSISVTTVCSATTAACIAATLLAIQGLPGAPGIGIESPQGEKGDQGDSGDVGPTGLIGPSYFTKSGINISYGDKNSGSLNLVDLFENGQTSTNSNGISIFPIPNLYNTQDSKKLISTNYLNKT